MTSRKPISLTPRDRILETASRLFYRNGIRAVGVDSIIAEADVAKMTFYKHFKSKDLLVLEFLKRRDAAWRAWFEAALSRLAPKVEDRPLAIFDALAERFSSKEFRGCAFINTMVEMADGDHVAHQAAAEHKQKVQQIVGALLSAAGVKKPEALAQAFLLLMDGAIVTAVRERKPGSAKAAKKVAATLLSTYKLQEK
ncbi:MAG: TetR/AcrR family transcriptional regulator [Gammaproteobacteria bacterium]|nr:TetR/AcrR family transcriptional regulator [Gammaproteobacteria bacterium]